jgi:prephenate dehydrogenase
MKIAVLGVGLIGGSVGLAARKYLDTAPLLDELAEAVRARR